VSSLKNATCEAELVALPADEGVVTVNNVKLSYVDSDLQNREVAFAMSQAQRDHLLQGE
jgi:hypothetical protein